jgi:hypothetical protein
MALFINHNTDSRIVEWHNEHAYSNDGETYFPSVTTILGIIDKGEHLRRWYQMNGVNADYLMREAQEFGKKIHRLTEQFDVQPDRPINVREYDVDGKVVFEYDNRTWEFLSRYVDFRQRFPIKLLAIEQSLCSDNLKVGGTIDRIFELNGERYLVDIKTGGAIYKEYSLQLYAYKLLWEEAFPDYPIDKLAIMHLDSGTRSFGKKDDIQGYGWKLKIIPLDIPYLEMGWSSAFNMFNWDAPDWKPFFQKYPDHYCAQELGITNEANETTTN